MPSRDGVGTAAWRHGGGYNLAGQPPAALVITEILPGGSPQGYDKVRFSALDFLDVETHVNFCLREIQMKNQLLSLALGASLLFGLKHVAIATPTEPTSPAEVSAGRSSAGELAYVAYYHRHTTVVRRGPVHGCVSGRRCVGGYHGSVCRRWAACR
jgi:hypothetical protein